jgi:2-amino-4-hydroxy-6-hydroxymethyldihydropteridine diphosphokinase
MSKLTKIYLGLGSNLGDRQAHLQKAHLLIGKQIGRISLTSRLYETQAWGKTDQPDFYNQAIEVHTTLNPNDVLKQIANIEQEMGRTKTDKWDARIIDIDILLFSDLVINEPPTLVIPHPELHKRNFVLVPLMEIAGEEMHPILQRVIEDIYFDCEDPLEVLEVENE